MNNELEKELEESNKLCSKMNMKYINEKNKNDKAMQYINELKKLAGFNVKSALERLSEILEGDSNGKQ